MEVAVQARAATGRSARLLDVRADSPSIDPWTADSAVTNHCPEIDCVRSLLPADVIGAAEDRAAALEVGADRVLIAAGKMSEEKFLRVYAASLNSAFEPLDDLPREFCPLNDQRLIECTAAGMLPLAIDGELCLVVAPRGGATRRIRQLIEERPARARYFRFTSAERLTRFALRHGGKAIAARATRALQRSWPVLSAGPPRWRIGMAPVLITVMLAAAAFAAPAATMLAIDAALALIFLAWLGLRLVGAFVKWFAPDTSLELPDAMLPVYTIIAALYREAASVDGLLAVIERLNYPAEKLDVIFVVEADDRETRAAITKRKTRLPITVIPIPAEGPRTKPKALNAALPFARGAFTVIYDAEDRPEAAQLRHALQAFHSGGGELGCVQARLSIDNSTDSWLARGILAQLPQTQ